MDDEAIVDLYWKRNENAIKVTDDQYGRMLSGLSYRVLSNWEDCKECVNDTYLKTWNSIPPHRPVHLGAYLSKITRQLSIDRWRKETSIKRGGSEYAVSLSELGDILEAGKDPETEMEARRLDEVIHSFLRSLPQQERFLFLERYFYFEPLKNAAKCCGMSESKAKSMLYRTRKKLRTILEKKGFTL